MFSTATFSSILSTTLLINVHISTRSQMCFTHYVQKRIACHSNSFGCFFHTVIYIFTFFWILFMLGVSLAKYLSTDIFISLFPKPIIFYIPLQTQPRHFQITPKNNKTQRSETQITPSLRIVASRSHEKSEKIVLSISVIYGSTNEINNSYWT